MTFPESVGSYRLIEEIGRGAFSIVAKVLNKKTNQLYAGKMIDRTSLTDSSMLTRIETELRIHQRLDHEAIAKVHEVIYTNDNIFIFMEYGQNGTIYEYLTHFDGLSEQEAIHLFHKLVSALDYLHSRGIAHRDLKLDNIVLTKDLDPKIIDFGLSYQNRFFDKLRCTLCGTYEYMPPEIIRGKEYDPFKADIWSLGICFYALIFNTYPFQGSVKKILNGIVNDEIEFPWQPSPLVDKILRRMLQKDPNNRISAKELYSMIQTKPLMESSSFKVNFHHKELICKPYVSPVKSFKNMKLGIPKCLRIRKTSSQPV